jgi:primosomal protein N'
MRDRSFDKLDIASKRMRENIDRIVARDGLKVTVRGPMPAVISRIQRFHRMQIIIQSPGAAIMQELFTALRAQPSIRPAVKIAIDVDPVNLL